MKISLDKARAYFLVRELIYDGQAGVADFNEPLSVDEIVAELSKRYGVYFDIDDKKSWVDWFSSAGPDGATETEKNSIFYSFKILTAEKRAIDKLKNKSRDSDA